MTKTRVTQKSLILLHGFKALGLIRVILGYKFEVNDFCVIVPTQEICYNQGIFATEVTDVKEEKTDNIYKVSFRLSNATTYIYEFKKKSDTQIIVTTPYKELTKK